VSSQAGIDVHEELAGASVTPLHKLLGVLITLITLFDGYDTFNPAYVIHYVMKPWELLPSQAGLLVSSGLLGFLFGAMGHGMAADRFGRRSTLLAGLWIVNVLTLLTALFATDFASFCILRFITGLGLGILLPLGTTYINELAPQRVSNRFSLWGVTLGWSLGGVVASLVGVFLTPRFGWQVLYWVGTLSVPLTLVVHAVLPESPKFLASTGRMDELRALLSRLRPERKSVY
jgi:AAHS family 4-hydroxybenzoate transporter-like MFS transporter